MSHPTVTHLLEAVQLFLKEAETALEGRLAFHARVAGNTLAVVMRELEQEPDAAEQLAFKGFGGVESVCAALRSGALTADDRTLLAAIRQGALARLRVDNPRYATFARLDGRPIPPDTDGTAKPMLHRHS